MDRQPERNIEALSKHVDTLLGKPEPTWNHIWHSMSKVRRISLRTEVAQGRLEKIWVDCWVMQGSW